MLGNWGQASGLQPTILIRVPLAYLHIYLPTPAGHLTACRPARQLGLLVKSGQVNTLWPLGFLLYKMGQAYRLWVKIVAVVSQTGAN